MTAFQDLDLLKLCQSSRRKPYIPLACRCSGLFYKWTPWLVRVEHGIGRFRGLANHQFLLKYIFPLDRAVDRCESAAEIGSARLREDKENLRDLVNIEVCGAAVIITLNQPVL